MQRAWLNQHYLTATFTKGLRSIKTSIGNFFVLKTVVDDTEKPISKWAKSRKPPFFHIGNIFIAYSARVKPHTHHWVTVLALHLCYDGQYGAIVDIIFANENTSLNKASYLFIPSPLTTRIDICPPFYKFNLIRILVFSVRVTERIYEKNENTSVTNIYAYIWLFNSWKVLIRNAPIKLYVND